MNRSLAVACVLVSVAFTRAQSECNPAMGDKCAPIEDEIQEASSMLQTRDHVQRFASQKTGQWRIDAPHLASTEHWSGGAKSWLERFPELEVAVNDTTTHAERCVQIWKALGENHWMEFVDGRGHAGGPRVFDHTTNKSGNKSFENQDITYNEFSTEGGWKSRWSADKLAELNARYVGRICPLWEGYVGPICGHGHDQFDTLGTSVDLNASAKKSKLIDILSEYHDAIDAIGVPMSDRGGSTHIQQALPYIARLYHKLALLHPFSDGNSRTRAMVLQTELVRQGGHPAVLWDNYHGIYDVGNVTWGQRYELLGWRDPDTDTYGLLGHWGSLVQEFVLDGWCAWEIAYNKKSSPFLPFVQANGTLLSTPHAEYNAVTGACEKGPMRSFWKPAFDKNHAD